MKKSFLFILPFFLIACGGNSGVPKNVLPIPKMTAVLWDVMLADGLATYRYHGDTTKQFDTSIILYKQIVAAHGTTQDQFKQSMTFYESRPDLLQIIIDTLQKRSSQPSPSLTDTARKPFKQPVIAPVPTPQ